MLEITWRCFNFLCSCQQCRRKTRWGRTYFIQNVAINEFIDRKQRLRPFLVCVPGSHLDRNGPTTSNRPQVFYALREGENEWIKHCSDTTAKKKKNLSTAQKYVMCALLDVLLHHRSWESDARSRMSGVRVNSQLSGGSSEREDSEGYSQMERQLYQTLVSDTGVRNQGCCDG